MLDIKLIRQDVEEVIRRLNTRNGDYSYLREVVALDEKRREILAKVEELKNFRNEKSKQIGINKRQGLDVTSLMDEVSGIGEEIAHLDEKVSQLDADIFALMAKTPNLPNQSLPVGKDETANEQVRTWGEPRKFDFAPKAHWDIGTNLDILETSSLTIFK